MRWKIYTNLNGETETEEAVNTEEEGSGMRHPRALYV